MKTDATRDVKWAELLKEAVERPGSLLEAYSNFHSYSLGNCWLAYLQCQDRGIPFGPFATYRRWQELGRQVRKPGKAFDLGPISSRAATTAADRSVRP